MKRNGSRNQRRAGGIRRGTSASINQQGQSAFKIGWTSNAPWAGTGYGQQTAQATTHIKEAGYDVAILSNYGLEATAQTWNSSAGDIPIYPRGFDLYSNDVTVANMSHFVGGSQGIPHALITLYDVWVYKGRAWDGWNIASWTPIDHTPAPPDVLKWLARENVLPIAMSRFGETMISNADLDCVYVPHGISADFKPTKQVTLADGSVMSPREFMDVPEDAFVVLMNSANKGVTPNRKAFGENFLAFAMFAQEHPDAYLYVHSLPTKAMGGIDLIELAKSCGITPDRISFTDPYLYHSGLTIEQLALLYSGADVLLATSYGEGFGVPTIEAQACGTPVIVSDTTASTELVGHGWTVSGQPLWDAMQSSWFFTPYVPSILDALNNAYQSATGARSEHAQAFASEYESKAVFQKYWMPVLERLEFEWQKMWG